MRFLCITDIHGKASKLSALLERERGGGIDCILVAGDITMLGGSREADRVMRPLLNAGVPLFAVHGNMDMNGVLGFIDEKGISIHGKTVVIGSVSVTGVGGSNVTPFKSPTEYSESQITELLEKSGALQAEKRNRILVSHTPPINTRLDIIANGTHAGSTAVRDFIVKENIKVCISGHIHESAGIDGIGECACVNSGAFLEGKYCIINFDTESGESVIELKEVD
jgi:Icc-related predicted phosphoesterase